MEELSGVIVFKHNSIRINKGKVIYIDGSLVDKKLIADVTVTI